MSEGSDSPPTPAGCGWVSDFKRFETTAARDIRAALACFVADASPEQVRAWDSSIPPLQQEVREVLSAHPPSGAATTILEYRLPMELRRPDLVLLVGGAVLVVELKGKERASQADVDQVSAYARDLRAYHLRCADREVVPILVPTRARGYLGESQGVHVAGPDSLDSLILRFTNDAKAEVLSGEVFLQEDAYRPLPTLVHAARELFRTREVRRVWRARAATDPAVDRIAAITHEAAQTKSRRLVLLTGVPGAGKTLVGLRAVHAEYLDDLAVARPGGKPTAPAVFLSGNGPLVEVLQYELRGAGGDGKTFVRGVLEYVRRYSVRPGLIPPEHVLVFDEAQRAFDAEQVREKHAGTPGFEGGKSEPEHIIEFADRIPGWCVVVGLIGEGQEIHVGEEAGIGQWRKAVTGSARSSDWTVHAPPRLEPEFLGLRRVIEPALNLDTEIRFHLTKDVHAFVDGVLHGKDTAVSKSVAERLELAGFHLRLTRDLETAKRYFRERYSENSDARYGIVASSKDKILPQFGIPNDFQSTKQVRPGPWYADAEETPGSRSCRHLTSCVTEFGAQGLELDGALLAWGTDFIRENGLWSNERARGYQKKSRVRDPFRLRVNAYRVLLTRARDVCVVFVPAVGELDETQDFLKASGFRSLD